MDRQTITVDIAPGSGPIQRIRLSQGDIGRQLGVYIIQNGAAVDCSGYSAHLYVLKPDKNYYEKTCSISSNLISWETAEQETPLAGECKAQIRITSNGMDIGTANFIEAIEATPASGGTASESLISSMTQYVDAAETAARTAVEAEDTVEDIISTYSGIPGRVTNAENSLAATQDGLAIVANGNTHAAIASGQFVYVKNHGSLAEGLYVANSAIATNAALTTSNLTADGSGGLNALKAKIGNVGNTDLQAQVTSLNSKFTILQDKCTAISGVSHMGSMNRVKRTGNVAQVSAVVVLDSDVAAGNPILTLPYDAPSGSMYVSAFMDGTSEFQFFQVSGNSFSSAKALNSGSAIRLAFTYICT